MRGRPSRITTRAAARASHVSGGYRPRLVIMARLPVAGAVKSRLARIVGTSEATRFYRVASRHTIIRLSRQPFWETIVAVAPDAGADSPMLPPPVRRIGQGGGDLGARMHRPMRDLPAGPVCVIGTDIPAIRIGDIRRAFRLLGGRDVVFGPADDGGFWLVGMKRLRRPPAPYDGVAWSTDRTLEQVLRNLEGAATAFTTRLGDVDTAADLAREQGRAGRLIRPL